jgi:hypothetical protein
VKGNMLFNYLAALIVVASLKKGFFAVIAT